VTGASVQDRDGGEELLIEMMGLFHRLKLIWADGGYAGGFVERAMKRFKRAIQIVKRCDDLKGFKVLAKRWIVERTFGWFSKNRRLSKDDELLPESSEAMIHIAMINLMAHRIHPG